MVSTTQGYVFKWWLHGAIYLGEQFELCGLLSYSYMHLCNYVLVVAASALSRKEYVHGFFVGVFTDELQASHLQELLRALFYTEDHLTTMPSYNQVVMAGSLFQACISIIRE